MPSPQDQAQQDAQDAALAQAISQMPTPIPLALLSSPGCTRDGSRFSVTTYLDMQWCRFYQGKPWKMLGYREQVRDIEGIANNIDIFTTQGFAYVHTGTPSAYQRYAVNLTDGTNTGTIVRTPSGYVANPLNIWQDDAIFQVSGGVVQIFAAATPALGNIADETVSQVYYGPVTSTSLLAPAVQNITAVTGAVAFPQTISGAGFLILNVNAPIPVGAGHLSVTTNGNLAAVNITVTGTDTSGNPLTVGPTALPNNTTLDLGSTFGTVSSVAISGSSGGLTIAVGYLAGSNNLTTTGGLCVIGPYLFLYGASGVINWSVPGVPLNFNDVGSGNSRPVADKIVRGMPIRGQAAPAGIFWSLSSVIIGQFVGGITFWNFNTVSVNSSIMSQNAVVENNGIYYWASTSGFQMFSGVVQDIPNQYNKQFFLKNMNYTQRQKCFAYKVPRWNEIWWCFPFGPNATQCNHAVIYKYDTGEWYDTPLPNGGRSAGHYDVTYNFPLLAGVDTNADTGGTSIWQHELGYDEVSGQNSTSKAINSFFQTQEFSNLPRAAGQPGDPRSTSYSTLEPDFNQTGNMYMEVFSRENANAPVQTPMDETGTPDPDYPYLIYSEANAPDPNNELVDFKWNGRLTSFKFTSNVLGGNYEGGVPLMWSKPDQGRRTG